MITYRSSGKSDFFAHNQTFQRGIVFATNIQNSENSAELQKLLSTAIENAANNPINLEQDPRISCWMEAHRQFGSNPNKYPPAHRALLKRVQKSGASLPFINNVVAIMNCNSITYKIPVGGDDLAYTGQNLELRYANGTESFIPLGCPQELEHPDLDEVIYVSADSNHVMCRRWNWRNGHQTAISHQTTAIAMNIDGLGHDCKETVIEVRDQIAQMLKTFCHADVQTGLINLSHSSCEFFV
jgi:DNA/RNA-binding domain of Phe-tRNA-synthetase-like protein